MTNNFLRLLPIKRRFPWYISHSLSRPEKKIQRTQFGSRLGELYFFWVGDSPKRCLDGYDRFRANTVRSLINFSLFKRQLFIKPHFCRNEGFLHRESKDTKLLPITSPNINRFSIFSLADSVVNLQQGLVKISHHTLNMSVHYLVKYEWSIISLLPCHMW